MQHTREHYEALALKWADEASSLPPSQHVEANMDSRLALVYATLALAAKPEPTFTHHYGSADASPALLNMPIFRPDVAPDPSTHNPMTTIRTAPSRPGGTYQLRFDPDQLDEARRMSQLAVEAMTANHAASGDGGFTPPLFGTEDPSYPDC